MKDENIEKIVSLQNKISYFNRGRNKNYEVHFGFRDDRKKDKETKSKIEIINRALCNAPDVERLAIAKAVFDIYTGEDKAAIETILGKVEPANQGLIGTLTGDKQRFQIWNDRYLKFSQDLVWGNSRNLVFSVYSASSRDISIIMDKFADSLMPVTNPVVVPEKFQYFHDTREGIANKKDIEIRYWSRR